MLSTRTQLPGYSTLEVARLLGLRPERVRAWVRSGFLEVRRGKRGELLFSFQDLVVLRAAQGLIAARIPTHKVRRSLERLRGELPQGRPLAALKISAEGSQVVVRDGGEAWEPESGQRVLDFEVAELAAEARPLTHRTAEEARQREAELSAEDWYAFGIELEASAPGEARDAYRRSLELAPEHPDAHLNLGRLLHEAGHPQAAESHYRQAASGSPTDPTAAFNLGVALQDLGLTEQATEAYRRAINIDPSYADAFYNLAGLQEASGDKAAALRSLKTYKSLTETRR